MPKLVTWDRLHEAMNLGYGGDGLPTLEEAREAVPGDGLACFIVIEAEETGRMGDGTYHLEAVRQALYRAIDDLTMTLEYVEQLESEEE